MLYKYTITYSSGATEDIQSSNETAELQSNSTFGMGLEQANEMGCNVAQVEEITPPEEWVSTEGEITSFSQEEKTFAESKHDYSETIAPGQKITLAAVEGEDEAKAAIDGQEAVIINAFPVGFQLDLDLSEVNVEGLTAKFESQEPVPVEEPVPQPPESTDEEVDPGLVTFRYFTRDMPTTAFVDDTDVKKIKLGDFLTLTAVAGLEDMMALADGREGEVQLINGTNVQLAIDMRDIDTTGLAMTAIGTPIDGSENPDPPDPGDTTGTITSFTAANPTEVTMDIQDESMITVGTEMVLEGLTGDPETITLIHGQRVAVLTKDPVTLALDLTGYNVVDLTADFTLDEAPNPGATKTVAKKAVKKKAKKEAVKNKAIDEKKDDILPMAPTDSPQDIKKSLPKRDPNEPAIGPKTPPWGQPSEPVQDLEQAAKDANKPTPLSPDTGK
jgi:hypothetical protein